MLRTCSKGPHVVPQSKSVKTMTLMIRLLLAVVVFAHRSSRSTSTSDAGWPNPGDELATLNLWS